jgi:endonuclease YncB( thermonuclease family)
LLQIDAPELGEGECHARVARAELERLAPPRTRISLEPDLGLDDQDRFGRRLRYVFVGSTNVNVELVRRGAATPYFRGGEKGRYADELLDAVEDARSSGRGMWRACRVSWQPDRLVTTRRR